jgi:hypothetical protein
MEMRAVAAVAQDGGSLFSGRPTAPAIASPASRAPTLAAPARLGQVSAWRSPACGRPSQPEPREGEPSATCKLPIQKEGSLQALTLPVELVDRGDVIAVGQRFYRVDSVVQPHDRFEFPLIVLRSLETGGQAAIEFRNSDTPISVLRFPTPPRWSRPDGGHALGAAKLRTVWRTVRLTAPSADFSGAWRPAAGIHLTKGLEQ